MEIVQGYEVVTTGSIETTSFYTFKIAARMAATCLRKHGVTCEVRRIEARLAA